MKAGRLRERIEFQRRSTKEDEYGEQKDKWRTITSSWAAVEPLAGREFFASQQVQSDIEVRIACRYSSELAAITEKDRIKHGAVYYDISSPPINVNSRNRELQFMCTRHSVT